MRIPILFCTDDSFSLFTDVSICSIIANASPDVFYDIRVICREMTDNHRWVLQSHDCKNIQVQVQSLASILTDSSNGFDNLPTTENYPQATYYRFLAPKVFPDDEKAIYIDGDTLITSDLKSLYSQDVSQYWLAAVPDQLFSRIPELVEYCSRLPAELVPERYINSGVLLMNLKAFRDEKISEKCLELIKHHNFLLVDQDAINIICADHILLLDQQYNYMVTLNHSDVVNRFAEANWGIMKTFADLPNLSILHFTGPAKPWNLPEIEFAPLWWKYARNSLMYEEILLVRQKISLKPLLQMKTKISATAQEQSNLSATLLNQSAALSDLAGTIQHHLKKHKKMGKWRKLGCKILSHTPIKRLRERYRKKLADQ